MSSLAVDDKGRLDCGKLKKELLAALEQDDKRIKVDAMKKRAILSASNYDEFRHMVDCAHLKSIRSVKHVLHVEKLAFFKQEPNLIIRSNQRINSVQLTRTTFVSCEAGRSSIALATKRKVGHREKALLSRQAKQQTNPH